MGEVKINDDHRSARKKSWLEEHWRILVLLIELALISVIIL